MASSLAVNGDRPKRKIVDAGPTPECWRGSRAPRKKKPRRLLTLSPLRASAIVSFTDPPSLPFPDVSRRRRHPRCHRTSTGRHRFLRHIAPSISPAPRLRSNPNYAPNLPAAVASARVRCSHGWAPPLSSISTFTAAICVLVARPGLQAYKAPSGSQSLVMPVTCIL